MQRSRSPFAAHQRKKSPRASSPRKSPFARGSTPKRGRKSPFARGSSPKKGRKSPFACGSSPKKMSPARRSPFACGSSPTVSRWEVTKSPYKSLFSREDSPRKSPFAVKGMKYHLPACYKGFSGANGNVCRQKATKYYKKDCYGPKTKAGRPDHCDPGLDDTPKDNDCYWGWRNTIWGDTCQKEKFAVMKDGNDPNIRCMGGPPKCVVTPKYKTFSPDSVKKSAECYSGFQHRKGFKDPICRRLEKATKYSDTPCFGPKGKDGKRPESCEKTTTNKTNSAECYSGFMHGKKGKRCIRLAKATKYSNTPCFGPKKNGIRPTSCDITTQNFTEEELTDLAKNICDFYANNKKKYDEDYKPEKKVKKLISKAKQFTTKNLSIADKLKLFEKLGHSCFEIAFTENEKKIWDDANSDPEKIKAMYEKHPEIKRKLKTAQAISKEIVFLSIENNEKKSNGSEKKESKEAILEKLEESENFKKKKEKLEENKNQQENLEKLIEQNEKEGKSVEEQKTYLDMLREKSKNLYAKIKEKGNLLSNYARENPKKLTAGLLALGVTSDLLFNNGGTINSAATMIQNGASLTTEAVKNLYNVATYENVSGVVSSGVGAVQNASSSVYNYFANMFSQNPSLVPSGVTAEKVVTALATAVTNNVMSTAVAVLT
jgi:hypothetical protein